MTTLLTNLFGGMNTGTGTTSSGTTSRTSSTTTTRALNTALGTTTSDAEKIIGPLYGQLTFANVPGTKKIIVISNIAEAYPVVEEFIKQLDREEMAVMPFVKALRYADCEDLSRRLNTIFAAAGQASTITLTTTGLITPSSMSGTTSSTSSTSSTSNTYTPPWSGSSAGSSTSTEEPTSNVLGKVRFMPEPSSKSILVLAPAQFMTEILKLIDALDKSGKQVVIETAIVEVKHDKLASLGLEFSQGGTLDKAGIFSLSPMANLSGGTPSTGLGGSGTATLGTLFDRGDFKVTGITTNILIDFLVNKADGRILNRQTLWTKDNTEAQFFKGKTVPFVTGTSSTTTASGPTVTYSYTRNAVGMEVRVRPSITPESNVNMIVNVNYSQLAGIDAVSGQTVTSDMVTTTNMIVKTGDTLILGGILFQTDQTTTNKIPGLGDIPVVGLLFGHDKVEKSTNELLVFLTPRVIDTAPEDMEKLIEATKEALRKPRERYNNIVDQLNSSMKEMEESGK
jgi:general secretion pathway protein D